MKTRELSAFLIFLATFLTVGFSNLGMFDMMILSYSTLVFRILYDPPHINAATLGGGGGYGHLNYTVCGCIHFRLRLSGQLNWKIAPSFSVGSYGSAYPYR